MSQSATPATQNDMTTCLETFEKERFAASPIDTAKPQENQRLETRRVGGPKPAFRARLPPILTLSTRYQTGWNVQTQTCLETFEKEMFCSFPHRHGEAAGKPETRDETLGGPKRAFRARLPPILTLCSLRIDVFLRVS